MSIVTDIMIFENTENPAKLYGGPTLDKPGPTLEIQEREAVKLVVKSFPSKETTKVQNSRIRI